jgi:hypothetical protein
MAGGTIPRDGDAAKDRPAPPLHNHSVLKILEGDDDHGLLDVYIENQLVDVGII